jgi:hypothetical protein
MEAINQFRQDNGSIGMAVCCRIGDFKALETELKFQAAVFVQPLSASQVEEYLKAAKLDGVMLTVQQDVELQKLASNPLFLWILSLAYQDRSADELRNLPDPERLQILFDRYIEQMFRQRHMDRKKKDQMIVWLGIIAKQMGSEKEFIIERMQPQAWLLDTKQKRLYKLNFGLIFGLIFGLFFRLIGELIFGLINGLIGGLIDGLIDGLIGGLFIGLTLELSDILTVEFLDLSLLITSRSEVMRKKKYLNFGLIFGLIFGLTFGLVMGLSTGLSAGLILGLSAGLILGLSAGLILGLRANIQTRTIPNEGVWNSLRNTVLTCSISLVITAFLYLAIFSVSPMSFSPMSFVQKSEISILLVTLGAPFILAFIGGGGVGVIQHFTLRLVLYNNKLIPWDFVKFFQQAEDRLFIQRTGGSYIFIHRYLQEHFASLAPKG